MSGNAGKLVIGTRGSALARWQAQHIADMLGAAGHTIEQRIIKTTGDRVRYLSFDKMEGKGFFTKELEEALLKGDIDLAVHSCKDLETRQPEGLVIAAITSRAASEELLLMRPEAQDRSRPLRLREGASVGTSSARRKSQLMALRPDLRIGELRGNVPTRVEQLRAGMYDAVLLAKAGVDRLGIDVGDLVPQVLDARWFVPAPAQGALALQTRASDERARSAAMALHDDGPARIVEIERRVLNAFKGGCQVPLGAHARADGDGFKLWVSAARSSQEMPRRVFLRGADTGALALEAVRVLNAGMAPARVLVTRGVPTDSLMRRMLGAHGIHVHGAEFFTVVPVRFTVGRSFDRIFFTSRNAVEFYFRGGGAAGGAACDAIGTGTAEQLAAHGINADFIGDGPDARLIAAEYAQRFADKRVLFPCAVDGQRTVQRALSAQNVIDLHVYALRAIEQPALPHADIAIVTAPKNAEVLDALRPLAEWEHVIAMGTTTAHRVRELSGRDAIVPWSSSDMALIDAVFGIASEIGQ